MFLGLGVRGPACDGVFFERDGAAPDAPLAILRRTRLSRSVGDDHAGTWYPSGSMRTELRAASAALLLLAAGCVRYEYPYRRAELAVDSQSDPARALVHYLRQPGSDAAACDPESRPAVARIDADVIGAVAGALEEENLRLDLATKCLQLAVAALPPQELRDAFEHLSRSWLRLARAPERDARALAVLEAVLVDSPASALDPGTLDWLATQLADSGGGKDLRLEARAGAARILEANDISRGRWRGRVVSAEMIAAEADELVLATLANRLPSPAIRKAALGELLRRRARASPFAEVRQAVDEVVERVMETGQNAVDLAATPVRRMWLEIAGPEREVTVRQAAAEGRMQLLVGPGNQLEPQAAAIPLRGYLRLELAGIASPVTVCEPAGGWALDPCVPPEAIRVENSGVRVEKTGALSLPSRVWTADAVAWLGDQTAMPVVFTVGAVTARLAVPVWFEEPDPLVLEGPQPGGNGPELAADVEERSGHLLIRVLGPRGDFLVIVPGRTSGRFRVESRGGTGAPGRPGVSGRKGRDGTDGWDASCHGSAGNGGRGHDGSPGGDGGPGGPGGQGGDVFVRVSCRDADCPRLLTVAPQLFRSSGGLGGAGGPGGSGGSGGDGGKGGSSKSCSTPRTSFASGKSTTTYDRSYKSSGSSGMRGSTGRSGHPGPDGPPGLPGAVQLVLTRPPGS